MANWGEAIDNKLQWHDFLNPVGMASYIFHGATSAFSDADQKGGNLVERIIDPQGSANAFNAREAEKQRSFEREMSNTAYQRGVADMRAAGLNPYAVYAGAQSASTPSGSSAYSAPHAKGLIENLVGSAFMAGFFKR